MIRPFLRWAGGKRRLAGAVIERLGEPAPGGRYVEPFVGGGAVYFATRAAGWTAPAVLADANPDLVALYRVVRDDLDALLDLLDGFERDREQYLEVRALDPADLDPVARAARTYVLNRCAFNGLWRVNRAGGFNVPYQPRKHHRAQPLVDVDELRAASEALAGAVVLEGGYEATFAAVGPRAGDVVYLDPPYHDNFVGYAAGGWARADLEQLAGAARVLVARDARVVVSYSNNLDVRRAFVGWRVEVVEARRSISCDGDRTPAREVLITSP